MLPQAEALHHIAIYHKVVYLTEWYISNRLPLPRGCIGSPEPSALEVLSSIQADLLNNPEAGDLVQGLAGIRKARCANAGRGKGKRGGYRYLFLYLRQRRHIHLLYFLDKDEQVDLSTDERKKLRSLAEAIKAAVMK